MNRSTRRGLLAITAGAAAAGMVSPAAAAGMPTPSASPVRDADGNWPRDLFPPGQHPTDYHGPSIPDEPDAELIAVCAEFDALEREINSYYSGGSRKIEDDEERDVAIAPFQDAQEPLLERIIELRASTPDGFIARARTLALWDPQAVRHIGPGNYLNERMLAALLRDMTGAPA